jgi:hypothetical protein
MRRITMTQYLLSARSVEGESRAPMTEEEMQQSYKQVRALEEEMKSAGPGSSAAACTSPAPPPLCACPAARC